MANILTRKWEHRVEVPPDDGTPIIYKWHFPRGTLAQRMSALELCEFLMPHMPSVLPLLSGHPRIQIEFAAMLQRLATWGKALDEILPWVKSVTRTEDADIIEMNLGGRDTNPKPAWFVLREPGLK